MYNIGQKRRIIQIIPAPNNLYVKYDQEQITYQEVLCLALVEETDYDVGNKIPKYSWNDEYRYVYPMTYCNETNCCDLVTQEDTVLVRILDGEEHPVQFDKVKR